MLIKIFYVRSTKKLESLITYITQFSKVFSRLIEFVPIYYSFLQLFGGNVQIRLHSVSNNINLFIVLSVKIALRLFKNTFLLTYTKIKTEKSTDTTDFSQKVTLEIFVSYDEKRFAECRQPFYPVIYALFHELFQF